jgi:hypothetical protein
VGSALSHPWGAAIPNKDGHTVPGNLLRLECGKQGTSDTYSVTAMLEKRSLLTWTRQNTTRKYSELYALTSKETIWTTEGIGQVPAHRCTATLQRRGFWSRTGNHPRHSQAWQDPEQGHDKRRCLRRRKQVELSLMHLAPREQGPSSFSSHCI